MGVLGGGQRIEGCLFGNGERTGNVDLITLALNLYTQGISPNLDLSDLQSVIDVVTKCNDLPIHQRYPYAGELVFTAFSGSHQDAIKKGFEAQRLRHAEAEKIGGGKYWDIPYLPIDPADLGQNYEAVIRVNSQSGKGGIAYLVKQHLHLDLPRKMQISFYQVVQAIADREAREMTVQDITDAFRTTYHYGGQHKGRISLRNFKISGDPGHDDASDNSSDELEDRRRFDGTLKIDGVLRVVRGNGNGPLSSLLNALQTHLDIDLTIRSYSEHSIDEGSNVSAASYVELVPADDRKSATSWWGVGVASDIAGSGLRAVLSAVNSFIGDRELPELKLNVGFNSKSSAQEDIASIIVNSLGLVLPRRLQSAFFEVVQRKARESNGEISLDDLTKLFRETYRYSTDEVDPSANGIALKTFELSETSSGRHFKGTLSVSSNSTPRSVSGSGNGPLSSLLSALQSHIVQEGTGTLSIREYSEHSLGEGHEVSAASFVELVFDQQGEKGKSSSWGIASDGDITASGLKAVVAALNGLEVKLRDV